MYEVRIRFEVTDTQRLLSTVQSLYQLRYGQAFGGYADDTREIEDALEALAAFVFNVSDMRDRGAVAVEPFEVAHRTQSGN